MLVSKNPQVVPEHLWLIICFCVFIWELDGGTEMYAYKITMYFLDFIFSFYLIKILRHPGAVILNGKFIKKNMVNHAMVSIFWRGQLWTGPSRIWSTCGPSIEMSSGHKPSSLIQMPYPIDKFLNQKNSFLQQSLTGIQTTLKGNTGRWPMQNYLNKWHFLGLFSHIVLSEHFKFSYTF